MREVGLGLGPHAGQLGPGELVVVRVEAGIAVAGAAAQTLIRKSILFQGKLAESR